MPGDEASLIRAKEHDCSHQLFWLTHASDGKRGNDLLRARASLADPLPDYIAWNVDGAGGDSVHVDIVLGILSSAWSSSFNKRA